MFGWILFGALVLLVFILFITPLRVHIAYERLGENDQINVEVTAWFRLIRIRYELPVMKMKMDADGPNVEAKVEKTNPIGADVKKQNVNGAKVNKLRKRVQKLLEHVHDMQLILKRMLKHVRCDKLEWQTTLGLGEAADTGALTGIAWGLKNMIVSVLAHYITMRTIPRVSIQPEWNNQLLHTQFRCILRFMVGHALIAGVRMLLKYRKDRKARKQKWQTTPTRV